MNYGRSGRRTLLGVLAGLALASAVAQEASETQIVAAGAAQLQAGIAATHPRVLLRAAEVPALRAYVATPDADTTRLLRAVLPGTEPAPLIAEPRAAKNGTPEGTRQWEAGYKAADAAGTWAQRHALAWLLTGDAAEAREAQRWLLHLASWQIDRDTYRTNDELFIQHLRRMILAWDWAYDALEPAARDTVRAALRARLQVLAREIQPKFSLLAPTPPDNSLSHPMRFISTLGLGGLALLHEAPEAPAWLAWSMAYYERQFPVWGGPAGGWAEGLNYWSTGITQHQRFLEAMAGLGFTAPLQRPFWRNTPYFAVYNQMPYPASSFGDLTRLMPPTGSVALILEKAAVLNADPYPAAFARALAQKAPTNFSYYTYDACDALLARWRLARAGLPAVALADLPQSRFFDDIGVVAMHSALGDAANDIFFALRASPQGSASHGFSDQGSFVLAAFGAPLAINSGYREYYGSAHHVGWARQTMAKNAVLFDGAGQRLRDASATGRITRFAEGAQFSFASADSSAAYDPPARRALRHAFFVDRRFVVLLDELQADTPMPFQWLLHALGPMQLDPAAARLEVRQGGARLEAHMLAPAPAALRLEQTDAFAVPVLPAYQARMPQDWHATVATRSAAKVGEFFSVLYPARAREAAPAISRVAAAQGFAAQVGDTLVLMAREDEARAAAAGWQLAGRAAALAPGRATLVEATALAGPLQLAASAPVSGEARWQEGEFTLRGHSAVALQLELAPGFAVAGVDGALRWQALDARRVRLDLPAGAFSLRVRAGAAAARSAPG